MDKPVTVSVVHKMSDAQTPTPSFFKQFVNVSIYAQVAEQMQNAGLVSKGSAAYVKRLPMNRGKPRSKWKVKRQYSSRVEKWEKAHLTEAKITGASFKIFKLGVRSAQAPHGQTTDTSMPKLKCNSLNSAARAAIGPRRSRSRKD
jgi:hypothetical protein